MRTRTTASRAAGRFCACTSDYSRLVRLHSLSLRCPSHSWTGFLLSTTHLPCSRSHCQTKDASPTIRASLFGMPDFRYSRRETAHSPASLGGEFEALFVRAQDITGVRCRRRGGRRSHWLGPRRESGRPVERRLDLGFGECRLIAPPARIAPSRPSTISGRRACRDFVPERHARVLPGTQPEY